MTTSDVRCGVAPSRASGLAVCLLYKAGRRWVLPFSAYASFTTFTTKQQHNNNNTSITMGAFDEPATYHSGENNSTTGREPFEDNSRDFIHGGNNTRAVGTGIPGTFGAGVGNTTSTTSHHTGSGLTGGATGAGLTGTHGKSHGLNRRGSASSSSSSSSEEEVDGVRRKKLNRTKKNKKPVGEKAKEAVGLGGAGAGVAGTHGKHETSHGSHIESSHTTGQHGLTGTDNSRGLTGQHGAGVTGVTQQGSHGLGGLHGERDAYNEGVPTRKFPSAFVQRMIADV